METILLKRCFFRVFFFFFNKIIVCFIRSPPNLGETIVFALSVHSVVCLPSHFVSAQYLENHLSQSPYISHVDWSL